MAILNRWLAPAALAVGLGFGAMTPAPAQAQDTLTRVLVDVADVVLRGGQPYYRYGDYGSDDRLIVQRDRYGREAYYRMVPALRRQRSQWPAVRQCLWLLPQCGRIATSNATSTASARPATTIRDTTRAAYDRYYNTARLPLRPH